uniref:Tyr recombinase domain-containing protein n=2 Tax=Caenorhabditis japonica TaxID=281687 RepID=A0A2Q4T7Z4_CAEJA
MSHLVHLLEQAPLTSKAGSTAKAYTAENAKRIQWMSRHELPQEEGAFLLYLAERSISQGSSSLSKSLAAYQLAHDALTPDTQRFATELIRTRKRKESETRRQPAVASLEEINKVIELAKNADPKTERDVLITLLSWTALLRASEVSELKWTDLVRHENCLEVHVRRAKNDQEANGRSTFVTYEEGSDLDILLARWKVRAKGSYVFPNHNDGSKLSPSAISSITKRIFESVGIFNKTHHSIRRGAANAMQAQGFSRDQIKAKGRWRSDGGVARYLVDCPEAQGIPKLAIIGTSANKESEEGDVDEGPPVLEKEF